MRWGVDLRRIYNILERGVKRLIPFIPSRERVPLAEIFMVPIIRRYFWRAYFPDGTVLEQFDKDGQAHSVSMLASIGIPIKVVWVTFSWERALRCAERGILALASVRAIADERIAAELESLEGRMVVPSMIGQATLFFDTGIIQQEFAEYHLEHPEKTVILYPDGRIAIEVRSTIFKGQEAPIRLGGLLLNRDFELKKEQK